MDEPVKGWPLASGKRVEKLEKWAKQTDKRLQAIETAQAETSVGALMAVLAEMAKGIWAIEETLREQGQGGIDQAALDKMFAGVEANSAGILAAQQK